MMLNKRNFILRNVKKFKLRRKLSLIVLNNTKLSQEDSFLSYDKNINYISKEINEKFALREDISIKALNEEIFKFIGCFPSYMVTIFKETQHDMSVWSVSMENERKIKNEEILNQILNISSKLSDNCYYSFHLDPFDHRLKNVESSLNAYLDFENNHELQKSVDITYKDIGCCKALWHKKFRYNCMFGLFFTNAPPNILEKLLKSKI